MLNRTALITKFHASIRQLASSSPFFKQASADVVEATPRQTTELQPQQQSQTQRTPVQGQTKQFTQQKYQRSGQQQQQQERTRSPIKNNDKINSFKSDKPPTLNKSSATIIKPAISTSQNKNISQPSTWKSTRVKNELAQVNGAQSKKDYESIVNEFKDNVSSMNGLLKACKKLDQLYSHMPIIAESFIGDPIRPSVVSALTKNMNALADSDDIMTLLQFLFRFNPGETNVLCEKIQDNLSKFDVDQMIKLCTMMRSPSVYALISEDLMRNVIWHIKLNLLKLKRAESLTAAMRMFSNEQSVIKLLDDQVIKSGDQLLTSVNDWIRLLNTKSITRQRNLHLLELCLHHVGKAAEMCALDLGQLQQCLLSCAILSIHDEQFYKHAAHNLAAVVRANTGDRAWLAAHEATLDSVVTSLGVLHLKDQAVLDAFAALFDTTESPEPRTLANFVITCANLNARLSKADALSRILGRVQRKHFACETRAERVFFLNYVWSLCALDRPDKNLVGAVLDESFWSILLEEFSDNDFRQKPILLKLLNINLYSILFMDDYEGEGLSDSFNLANFSNVLMPSPCSFYDTFASTISSFRSVDKFTKLNLLTPYGIVINALMVIDQKGAPCPISAYFNDNVLIDENMKKGELKVAIKLVSFRDYTQVNKGLNGVTALQLKLLAELGYQTLIITQKDMAESKLIERIDLIQSKLRMLAEKKSRTTTENKEN